MSLLKAIFGGGSKAESTGTGRLCVIDGERMIEGREAGPGDRFQTLQRLAKFHEREKIKMQVVFGGRPLREAEHGAEFNGVKVFYTEQGQNYIDAFMGIAKEAARRDSIMVITNDLEIEKRAVEMGAVTLRTSTLRKAFESEGGGEGGFRGGEGRGEGGGFRGGDRGGRRRGGRGGRSRGPGGERGGRPQQGGDQPAGETQSGGGEGGGRQQGGGNVSNLIDLVE
jgi:hypothetical protein